MRTIIEQETLVDTLEEIETKLYDISEQLSPDDELSKAWCIVYRRLYQEKDKEAKMKGEVHNDKR